MARALLTALVGILIAVTAYYGTLLYVGARPLDAFRPRRALPPAWPLPEAGRSHPFWARFPDLENRSPERRAAAVESLLGLDRGRLPHPAFRPSTWTQEFRAHARALLWSLYRGRAFRADGLELELTRSDPTPVQAGRPVAFELFLIPAGGITRPRLTTDLDQLVRAGARVHLVTRPPGRAAPGPVAPANATGNPAKPIRIRDRTPLSFHPLDAVVFSTPGPCTVIAALDLRNVTGTDGPRGLLVSQPLTIQVVGDRGSETQ